MVLRRPGADGLQPDSAIYPVVHPPQTPTPPHEPLPATSQHSTPAELADTSQHSRAEAEIPNLRNEDSDSDWDASEREDDEVGNSPSKVPRVLPASLRVAQHNPTFDDRLQLTDPISEMSAPFPHGPSPQPASSPSTSAKHLHIHAQSLSLESVAQPPQSPSGRSNKNPFRKESFNEQAPTPPAEFAPTNPFRRHAQEGGAPLITLDASPTKEQPDVAVAGIPSETVATPSAVYPSEPAPSQPAPAPGQVSSSDPAPLNKPLAHVATAGPSTGAESPTTSVRRTRHEVYQIRNIKWKDPTSSKELRESPILIQNANGPCPLLALVNGLVLSTPPGEVTALIDTLKARENVSLGLLLDAVFDELMSDRRGSSAVELPDVDKLYSFLLALHTGMNVNPRFVSRDDDVAGGFEDTKEMQLYSTFELPLLHGWLPSTSDPAYTAFARSAPSYEDAQNLLFREEELERALESSQLNAEDEAAFMDLAAIKHFLHRWPTQLTEHGLSKLHESIKSCQVAILFRNDHFSTLYKEPSSGRLMALVTDAGYAPHAEVVWESLLDTTGSGSELFSGDFRLVSHVDSQGRARAGGEEGWTTVDGKLTRAAENDGDSAGASTRRDHDQGAPAALSASEQEDHDLALAMQLQEEEEERQRNEQAARRREERLSQQFLSQDASNRNGRGPDIPPRRSQQSTSPARQASNAGGGTAGGAPPTYEEARHDRAYHPPREHPAHAAAPRQGMPVQAAPAPQARRGLMRRGRGSDVGPTSPGGGAQSQPYYMDSHEAVADRREGCSVM
ncbi:hypothetical protein FH972_022400 [Carpinus fangiana]|uniref:MINDY deubiquitinase domain-containing protein n=1 Tax=Carpinus fangiana TaxID=176857 RepID=A0A5N6KSG7_9ROSI|nr:hypothetical protein FH972_022400 [Carpinus fangiana]